MKKAVSRFASRVRSKLQTQAELHRDYARVKQEMSIKTPYNPALYGYKVYSQCDEDGIIDYIFSQIEPKDRTFVEIGCGDGTENNTHKLALSGWAGMWVDADSGNIKSIRRQLPKSSKLIVSCERVSASNVCSLVDNGIRQLGFDNIDFLSIDIDGDDLYVLLACLKHFRPRLLCIEYNAKFPPPMEVCVREAHGNWAGDDYQGASLSCLVNELNKSGYRLVSCNLSGVNAFFVPDVDASKLPSFTTEELYQPARYHLIRLESGHRPSLKFLVDALSSHTVSR